MIYTYQQTNAGLFYFYCKCSQLSVGCWGLNIVALLSHVKFQAPLLQSLAHAHPYICKAILQGADKDILQCLSQCALNVLKGNVPLSGPQKAKLTKYKQKLRKEANKKVSLQEKYEIVQTGGFVPLLLAPLLRKVIAPNAKRALVGLGRKAVGKLLQKAYHEIDKL